MDAKFKISGNDFVWNLAKAKFNDLLHGVRFEDAATVFFDPLFKLIDASRRGEARQAVVGFDRSARLLFVVHVEMEGSSIRLISARTATRSEEAIYVD